MQSEFIRKSKEAENIYSFFFVKPPQLVFDPGDFTELSLDYPDGGGGRRWFTIASAPHEPEIRIATKILGNPSEFKGNLDKLKKGDKVIFSPAMGSFNLPKSQSEKLIFVAAGVGITPYRSMLAHLKKTKQPYDIKIYYVCKPKERIFTYLLDNFDVSYEDSDFDIESIDATDKTIYLSGPKPVVENYFEKLIEKGVERSKIKLDYFPGYDRL